jgi:hypothetical protein
MKNKNPLLAYYAACQDLADAFVTKYYTDTEITLEQVEAYWIADQIGGVYQVNDQCWRMQDIVEALENHATEKQLFDWYEESMEMYSTKGHSINLENWLKSN